MPNTNTGSQRTFRGIAFGNNRYVISGSWASIFYSTDAATWTAVTNNGGFGTTQIRAVTYGNGRFVAMGDNGKMAYCDW